MSNHTGERGISLFMLEDDPQTLDHLQDIVTRTKESMTVSSCYSARTLADTEYFLEVVPRIGAFTHLLFDLDVEHYTRRRRSNETIETIKYGTLTRYAGLDYILDAYDHLPGFSEMMDIGRVAAFTGHNIDFLKKYGSTEKTVYDKIRCISKLDRDLGVEILEWLKGE